MTGAPRLPTNGRRRRSRRALNSVLVPVALLAIGVEFALYRWWHLRWGARPAEVVAAMPGDDLLPRAHFVATRAITIGVPPADVWPWLLQVGVGRGGFYSYDLLDNLGRHSAESLDPNLQALNPGDWIPMSRRPSERTAFRVAGLEAPRWMLWTKHDSTWAWQLEPSEQATTRLVTRLRCRYDWRDFPSILLTVVLMECGDFPMMRRMLLGIRQRAEGAARDGSPSLDSHAGPS
ncbi:MAG: hypothetical protein AB7I38_03835 [Dehalococcoidia bacterium]